MSPTVGDKASRHGHNIVNAIFALILKHVSLRIKYQEDQKRPVVLALKLYSYLLCIANLYVKYLLPSLFNFLTVKT